MNIAGKLIIIFVLTFLALAASAYAQSPREQLQQMVEQLQKTPTDNALREKMIKLGAEIKPAPEVPPEAKRPFVMAGTYQKEAKKPSDFALAIAAYQDALKIAPWWGDAYYNLSVSLESAGRLDEAKDALNLYLLTKPKDAEEAQNRLYALDAKKHLAAKQAAEAAVEKAAEAAKYAWILGDWSVEYPPIPDLLPARSKRVRFVKSGNTIIDADNNVRWRGTIQASGGIVWEVKIAVPGCAPEGHWVPLRVSFSADRLRATATSPTTNSECGLEYRSFNSAEMIRN